jgi:type II secretory pathway component PulF
MALFFYTAKNASGQTVHGNVEARTNEIAVSLLKGQGLFVMGIEEKRENLIDMILNFRGVPMGEVVIFTRQLATMISAGLPIARALEVLAVQSTNKAFKRIVFDILRSIEGG